LSVTRSLEIDDQLAEAHASLGFMTMWYDWDFPKAEREFLRAIELNPNYSTGHHWYSYCLMVMERFDEAEARIERALALDPLSLIIITDIGEQLYRRRRYDEAIAQFQKALDLDPEFALAKYWMLRLWIDSGKVDQTIAALEGLPMSEGRQSGAALLAIALARTGRHEESRKILADLLELPASQYVPPYYLALIEAGLGNRTQAFVWLEKAYQERSGWMPWLKQDPMLDGLRDDPRFAEIVRKVGLTP
jgi:tetratricopeptide (TPR) repeat protein